MRQKPRTKKPRHSESSQRGISWKYSVLTLMCGAILVTGFFFAGKLHFSSMDYGIRNSRLRKQLDELESEKRRLLLAREVSLSPAELIRGARRIGFLQHTESPEVAKALPSTESVRSKVANATVPVIQKTVISRPVEPPKAATADKPVKVERQAKSVSSDSNKKAKS